MNTENPLRQGRGTCQVCGEVVHLRRHTRVLVWHGPGSKGPYSSKPPCAGTGELPVELLPKQPDMTAVEELSEFLATAPSRQVAQVIASLREQLGDDEADELINAATNLID